MSLIIETGVAVRNANSYIDLAYVTSYLTDRNRQSENSWSTKTQAEQEAALIDATDYIDKKFGRRFRGSKKVTLVGGSATATLTLSGLPSNDETFILGDETWKFVSSLSGSTYEILIGASESETVTNAAAALNGAAGAGVTYGTATPQSRHATATALAGVLTLTALAAGTSGSLTSFSGSITNGVLSSFSGGTDGDLQPLQWPRQYAYDEAGNVINGIPRQIKQAVAEYAVRAVASTLLPDPSVDQFGGSVQRRLEKVGPIEEEYEYVPGSVGKMIFKPFPQADKILVPLLINSGGVIRG